MAIFNKDQQVKPSTTAPVTPPPMATSGTVVAGRREEIQETKAPETLIGMVNEILGTLVKLKDSINNVKAQL